jgi:alkaline phosphatase D
MRRRDFLFSSAIAAQGFRSTKPLSSRAPAIIRQEKSIPAIPYGVQCGDIAPGKALIWSRCDRPARMIVEYATTESFRNPQRVIGPAALETTDFTARIDLSNLPASERIFYRVSFQDLNHIKVISQPVLGSFRTVPLRRRDLTLVWGGDVCGQGWGINPDFGGLKIFETMRSLAPDIFIHSGDMIYADGPIQSEVKLDQGIIWKNISTAEKSKVAETLDEFRGNYRYNLLDENLRRFNSEVPIIAQWDDHEVRNNWYPGQIIVDDRYQVKSADLLAARGRRAYLDYVPIRFNTGDPERIYRSFNYGPMLDVFLLDKRSYRGPNTENQQSAMSDETALLGSAQINWLKKRLLNSKAVWKVIASDMPIGVIVADGKNFENCANVNGPALGRELEIAGLLRFIKQRKLRNIVWITADVHYSAAHYYDPTKARFTDFDPFWEFISGPLHAGTSGPGKLDDTFGPQVKYLSVPQGMKSNRPPTEGLQFFGALKIDGKNDVLSVSLIDLTGKKLFGIDFEPRR